jgi:uncharacterized protein YggE
MGEFIRRTGVDMRVLVLSLALAAGLALAGPALAEVATLTVNGQGTAAAAPDIASVRAGVETDGATAAEALAANSALAAKIIAALKAAGVAPRDIQTSGLNVQPLYGEMPRTLPQEVPQAPQVVGYRVSNTVAVTIRALDGMGAVLDDLVQAGANRIDSVSFGFGDDAAVSDEARRRAVADARRSAAVLAEAAGVKLVRVLSVNDGGSFQPQPMDGAMFRADRMAVPVETGESSVQANVTVVWEIGPAE